MTVIGQNSLKLSSITLFFFPSQTTQHPPEPNLVTLEVEILHSFKTFKQTKYTTQYKNPHDNHYLSDNCHYILENYIYAELKK